MFPVELPPEWIELAQKLGIHPSDIEEHFIRGSGAGGQKINKTASCVQLKHGPSGVEVKVQKHRERERNRASAYKLLIGKLEAIKMGKKSEAAKRVFKLRKQKQRRSRKSKEKMLKAKKVRSDVKALRKKV